MSQQSSAPDAYEAQIRGLTLNLSENTRALRLVQLQIAALQRAIEEIHGVKLSTHVREAT